MLFAPIQSSAVWPLNGWFVTFKHCCPDNALEQDIFQDQADKIKIKLQKSVAVTHFSATSFSLNTLKKTGQKLEN